MRKPVGVSVGAAALLGVAAAVVIAQEAPPTVTLTLEGRRITVQAPKALPAGPVRLSFRNPGRREREPVLLRLRPGANVAAVLDALPRASRDPRVIERLASIEYSGTAPGRGSAETTIPARPATYLVIDIGGRTPTRASFTVGARGSAVAPRPDARVDMVDYGFRGSRTLRRSGTVRVRNVGDDLHFAEALPLRRGVSDRRALRALRAAHDFQGLRRLFAGEGTEVIGLVSGGTSNDVVSASRDAAGTPWFASTPTGSRATARTTRWAWSGSCACADGGRRRRAR